MFKRAIKKDNHQFVQQLCFSKHFLIYNLHLVLRVRQDWLLQFISEIETQASLVPKSCSFKTFFFTICVNYSKVIWLYIYIHTYVYTHTHTHTYINIYILFQTLFHYRLLQDNEQSFLCYTVGLVIYLFYTQQCVSANPKLLIYPSPIPFPLVTINLQKLCSQ